MTDKPAESAVERYYALEWVPDGEMGFDPGGREVKAAADAAIAELEARRAADFKDWEQAALKAESLLNARIAELEADYLGLFQTAGDYKDRAEQAEAALAERERMLRESTKMWMLFAHAEPTDFDSMESYEAAVDQHIADLRARAGV